MPKSYSMDLRECVLRSIDEGQSKSAAHRSFHISRSAIDHWLTLREPTGSVSPRAMHRTRPPQLHGGAFEEFVRGHADASLDEMAKAWHEQGGVLLSAMSFSRALRRLGWTPKKSVGAIKSAMKRRARPSTWRWSR